MCRIQHRFTKLSGHVNAIFLYADVKLYFTSMLCTGCAFLHSLCEYYDLYDSYLKSSSFIGDLKIIDQGPGVELKTT